MRRSLAIPFLLLSFVIFAAGFSSAQAQLACSVTADTRGGLIGVDMTVGITSPWDGTAHQFDIDCTNDGIYDTPEFTALTTNPATFVDVCSYPSYGTYTARGHLRNLGTLEEADCSLAVVSLPPPTPLPPTPTPIPSTPIPTPTPPPGPQSTGGSIYFDLQPRTVSPTGGSVAITIRATIDLAAYRAFCQDSGANQVKWSIRNRANPSQAISTGYQTPLNPGTQTYSIGGSLSVSSGTAGSTINYFARLHCPSGTQVTESSDVGITYQSVSAPPPSGGTPPAPGTTVPLTWKITNPLKLVSCPGPSCNVFGAIFGILDWILNVAGSLILILIIYAGVKFILSRGNPGKIQEAKNILYWAIVGFGVILIGKGFIFLVESVLTGDLPTF